MNDIRTSVSLPVPRIWSNRRDSVPPGVDVLGVATGVIEVEPLPLTPVSDTNCTASGSTSSSSRSRTVCPGATAMLTV